MKFRTLGHSGLLVSEIGFGADNFGSRDDIDVPAVVNAALDAGVTLFDTADVYGQGGSETLLGKALGHNRKNIILTSKWGVPLGLPFGQIEGPTPHRGASRDYILKAVEGSLRRLGTDYIDLYQFHYPDRFTPAEETLQTLNDLVHQGKVRYFGVSNQPAWQTVEWHLTARLLKLNGPISVQDEYSLLKRRHVEEQQLPMLKRFGLGLLPYFPLASGMLTGKYRRGEKFAAGTRFEVFKGLDQQFGTARNFDVVERLQVFAKERGHTLLELAISWLLACPSVSSVIAGATTAQQVKQNVAAGSWQLTAEELAEVDKITRSLPEG